MDSCLAGPAIALVQMLRHISSLRTRRSRLKIRPRPEDPKEVLDCGKAEASYDAAMWIDLVAHVLIPLLAVMVILLWKATAIYLGDGSGNFPTKISGAPFFNPNEALLPVRSLVVSDLNKDSYPDVTVAFTGLGDPLAIQSPNGAATTFSFDSNGNLLTVSDPLGDTIALTYDAESS